MSIRTVKTTEVIKGCPNEKQHMQDLIDDMKDKPEAILFTESLYIGRNHNFCEKCGERLIDKVIEHEHSECDKCGTQVVSSDSYCPNCGNKL